MGFMDLLFLPRHENIWDGHDNRLGEWYLTVIMGNNTRFLMIDDTITHIVTL